MGRFGAGGRYAEKSRKVYVDHVSQQVGVKCSFILCPTFFLVFVYGLTSTAHACYDTSDRCLSCGLVVGFSLLGTKLCIVAVKIVLLIVRPSSSRAAYTTFGLSCRDANFGCRRWSSFLSPTPLPPSPRRLVAGRTARPTYCCTYCDGLYGCLCDRPMLWYCLGRLCRYDGLNFRVSVGTFSSCLPRCC